MNTRRVFFGALLVVLVAASLRADEMLDSLTGSCRIRASTESSGYELKLTRGECAGGKDCNNTANPGAAGRLYRNHALRSAS